jgi:DNA-binding transcriptional MerR regulator
MKISTVCEQAGVASTTLKYYIREGLVPEGERVGANKTEYRDAHVQRARLARALIETGGLSVASARLVLAALDAHQDSLAYVFEAAQRALTGGAAAGAAASAQSRKRVGELIGTKNWKATTDNPGYELAAAALDGFGAIGYAPSAEYLAGYADAAATVAATDLGALQSRQDPAEIAELMVVGTVLGDALFAGLRRLAQQHETTLVFPVTEGSQGGGQS